MDILESTVWIEEKEKILAGIKKEKEMRVEESDLH
mgnify:FL=1